MNKIEYAEILNALHELECQQMKMLKAIASMKQQIKSYSPAKDLDELCQY